MKKTKENADLNFFKLVLREVAARKAAMENLPEFYVSCDIWESIYPKMRDVLYSVADLLELSKGKTKILGCDVYLVRELPARTIKVGRDVDGNTPREI